jgi:hypothetical protein
VSLGSKPSPIYDYGVVPEPTYPLSVTGGAPILPTTFQVFSTGKITIAVAIVRGQKQAVPQIIQNGTPMDLNIAAGGTMNSGAKYDFQTGVQTGDTVNFQMSVSTQLSLLELNFVQDSDL